MRAPLGRCGTLLLLLVLACAAAPAAAQVIGGEVVAQGTGRLVAGAVVVLVDGAGVQRRGVLTDDAGRFRMEAPGVGRYTVRVERIGYRSSEYPAMELREGDVVLRRWSVPVEAVELVGVDVDAERRCRVRPREGLVTNRVWEEVRKALNASRWTEDQALLRYEVELYDRLLDGRRRPVRTEERRAWEQQGVSPFRSLPAESLARGGYVQERDGSTYFYAPDAHALLSDAFLDTHCFRLQAGRGERRGLVGLAFEPVDRDRRAEVRGVLWVDRLTAELRFLEYGYTGLRIDDPERLGGRVEFERLESGPWFVRRWWIRWPRMQVLPADSRGRPLRVEVMDGYREVGGEVTGLAAEEDR